MTGQQQGGECEECGEQIGVKRLAAIPTTTVCIGCAEAKEDNGQFQRHRMDFQPEIRCGEVEHVQAIFHRGTG